VVSSNLLRAFAARFAANAQVVQAEYGVRNPQSSWRTRLMTIALGAFHIVRSTAREHLQFSCGLRGNGMGFMTDVIRHHPPAAFSIVEDLEYGIQLGYAGIRIQYAHEASVKGLMAQTEAASRSQRRRWERGRQAIVRRHLGPILTRAWRSRDLRLFDLAVDLMVPPIGRLLTISVLGLLVSVGFGGLTVAFWLWCLGIGAIWLYVMMGWRASGVGWSGAFDLLYVPVYLVWKLTLRLRDRGVTPSDWVRTNREARL
jgi:cellulose synthase/poly-beta-1,6-N-acetylglucosamine synthase-like glycosyltransferase